MKIIRPCGNGERGTQVAELAIILPLMLLLSFIIAEGAGFIRLHEVINNAAREGARLSTIQENADHTADIVNAISRYACNNGVQLSGTGLPACSGTPSVVCPSATITVLQHQYVSATPVGYQMSKVTVQCQYQLTYLPALPWFGISNQVALGGNAEFREFY